ncbi:sporulation-specific protein 15-like isoform X2 [Sipha flava]|uniref:Sporulation-specific protein 15-like isoform X2 n=1 Tax=Sipha flava TaxID=143950 RepID=A0A8B8FQZ7_9HEMI|nr:sporulation-specific protein 15-like isoform X2 [Sipha flava]
MDEDIIQPEETFDTIDEDLPMEKLLKLSKSFKMGVERNLKTFKKEKLTMMNEVTNIGNTTSTLNEESEEIVDNSSIKEIPFNKHRVADSNVSFLKPKGNTFNNLKQELKNENDSLLETQHIENEFKPYQNMISETHGVLNFNQADNEKINYAKSILEIENKGRHWKDKYDELYEKYLRLESKYMLAEKENCNNQIEIARIKTIENENLQLNQIIDKTNRVRKHLESALESCLGEVDKYKTDADIARNKVREAIEIMDKISSEKDRLIEDLNNSKEQISKLENELKNLIQEAGKKVKLEIENVKIIYKNKLREANAEIEILRTEKQIEGNKYQRISKEYEVLSKNYALINQKFADKPHEYSKKMTGLVKQNNEYEVTLNNIRTNVEILEEANRKLQDRKRPEDKYQQKNMQIKELTKHLEALKQLLDMWKIEVRSIIDGFKQKIKQLKQHCNKLYKTNTKLKRIINNSKINNFPSKRKQLYKPRKNKRLNTSSVSTST